MLIEWSWTIDALAWVAAACSLLILISLAAVKLSSRTGLPSLVLYVFLGMLLGRDGLGITFDNYAIAHVLSYLALILILAEGGLTTSWRDIERSIAPAAMLSTVGVGVSIGVIGLIGHLAFGWPWIICLLVGAVLSSTDAAAVFSVLRQVRLPRPITGILEAESGFNDAPVIITVVALSGIAAGTHHADALEIVVMIFLELVGGVLIGGLTGAAGAYILRRVSAATAGMFPIGVVACTALAYGVGTKLEVSGFMAVYIAALVLGNTGLAHRTATRGVAQALGWLAHIGLFIMLGMLVTPSRLDDYWGPALILGVVALLVARPLSVWVSLKPFDASWRDMAFISWAGLRGAVPIVAATLPLLEGVPGIEWLFDVVFVIVVVFTIVQGPLLPPIARLLKVEEPQRYRDLDVETTSLDDTDATLVEVAIGQDSRLHGVEVFELRLPTQAAVAMIIRDGATFVPHDHTYLRHRDNLIIVTPPALLPEVQERLHVVDARGRLARWQAPSRDH